MKITFEEAGDQIVYRVSDFNPKYEPVLQACFYEEDSRGYVRRYAKNAKYLDRMTRRYAAVAQTMFDQLGYFAPTPWASGLRQFCRIMRDAGIPWWLTGSCAACIRGVALEPHDVDVMFDSRDTAALTEALRDYLIEPITPTNGWVTRDFGILFLDARIDLASDPSPVLDDPEPADCGPYALAHLETVAWEGFQIKAPPLELQLSVNRRRGRLDRVQKIEAFLAKQAVRPAADTNG